MTPLHWALDARKPQALRLLLKYGVDVNVRDKSGKTLPNWHNRMDIKRLLNCCLRMVQSFFGEQLVNCPMELLGMDSDWLLARARMVNHDPERVEFSHDLHSHGVLTGR